MGHFARNCPNLTHIPPPAPHHPHHVKFDTRSLPSPCTRTYMSRIQCRNCNQMGHYARNCPNPTHISQAAPQHQPRRVHFGESQPLDEALVAQRVRTLMSIQCRSCNQYGHFAQNCTLNDTYEPPSTASSISTDISTQVIPENRCTLPSFRLFLDRFQMLSLIPDHLWMTFNVLIVIS